MSYSVIKSVLLTFNFVVIKELRHPFLYMRHAKLPNIQVLLRNVDQYQFFSNMTACYG